LAVPSIALVTPTLNQAGFLREAIDSVLAQGYPSLDYLVKDGGSSDGSQQILAGYGDRLQWISQPDAGQSAAINQGWRLTQGEIIGWLNSDDRLAPGALQRVGEYFAAHPEVNWIYGDCDYINAQGLPCGAYPARSFDYPLLVCQAENYIPQPAAFFRRSLLETAGWLDETLHFGMDYDLWLRFGLRCTAAYLPTRFAALRLHAGAKSVSQLGKFAEEDVLIFERLLSRGDLPAAIASKKRQIMGNVYLRVADIAFWGNRLARARSYLWKAWLAQPLHPRWLWVWLLLGSAGRRWAERLYGNPYLPK
jgi:glycosyltransferase involved in cell wall biosynthesis